MLARLRGKVALITGSSRGIGKATAIRMANEGADIVVNYNTDLAGAEATAAEVRSLGRRAFVYRADVRERGQVDALVSRIVASAGPIDILVNNAGILVGGKGLETSSEELRRALSVNVESTLYCIQAAAPSMIGRGIGKIINVSPAGALGTAVAGIVPHVLAKSALVMLTKQLSMELGPHQINVNAVCPGAIETEATRSGGMFYERLKDVRKHQIAHTTLGRIGSAEDVAAAIAFLASSDADYINGQALTIDGGRTDFLSHSG